MHRLLVATDELSKEAPTLPQEALAHLKVLRPKAGEEIELFDGKGRWRVYRVETRGEGRETRDAKRERAGDARRERAGDARRETRDASREPFCLRPTGEVLNLRPSPFDLVLFACVTKGSRWDWTIEKATELGATRIVPVLSARTIVRIEADEREAKRARWRRVAEDAARQSDAKWLPEVLAPVTFAESLALVKETACFVGALTTPPPEMIAEALARHRSARVSRAVGIYVGPEGDFTPEELAALLEVATPVSFGSTILRAETAAIYGLSVLKAHLDGAAHFGEMRPRVIP